MTAMFRQMCFAAMADDALRRTSSSGGAFTLFAREILARGGAVCGAAFDSRMKCVYRVASDEEGLAGLRGSKYVKAALGPAAIEDMRQVLHAGRPLLFAGTPCQVAAVKRLFAKEDGDLYLIDLVCNGAPRQDCFDRYLEDNWGRDAVAGFEFRNKSKGWRFGHALLHVTLRDGREFWRDSSEDEYMRAKAAKYSLSDGCFNCPYTTVERVGDITLCDFWHVEPRWDDGKGTSGILVNTAKGFSWFCGVKASFARIEECPVADLVSRQPRLRTRLVPRAGFLAFRAAFAAGAGVRESVERASADVSKSVAILNFHWETTNFGAVLTAYALNRAVSALGYEVRNIDFRPDLPRIAAKSANAAFDAFRRRHLPVTDPVTSIKGLRGLNAQYGSFLVGSDQVWNPGLTGWFRDVYWLSFVKPHRRRISVSASFGCDPLRAYGRRTLRRLLGAFDSVSVREVGAASALERVRLTVAQTADPVFLLTREDWLKLVPSASEGGRTQGPVWYVVNRSGERLVMDYLGRQSAEFRMKCHRLDARTSIEDWLDEIAHAPLVIADSFHAICFALIFRRPFLAVGVGGGKMDRLRGLLEKVGLADRFFVAADEIPPVERLLEPLDSSALGLELERLGGDLRAFLNRALSSPVVESPRRTGAWRKAIWRQISWAFWICARKYAARFLALVKLSLAGLLGRDVAVRLVDLRRRNAEYAGYKSALHRSVGELLRLKRMKRA